MGRSADVFDQLIQCQTTSHRVVGHFTFEHLLLGPHLLYLVKERLNLSQTLVRLLFVGVQYHAEYLISQM